MLKKLFTLLIMLTLGLSLYSSPFSAKENGNVHTTSRFEAVLTVDVSNSMTDSDKNKVSNEAMKMFVDMASVSGDKIGVVAYTDEVIREKALVQMRTEEDKDELKSFIDNLGRYPYTDLSVGVGEAVDILDAGHEDGYYPLIVVLTDGNNDFNPNNSRTQSQADKDLKQAVKEAKDKGYPVYTIGLNADGTLNKDVLKNVASDTGGKFFETSTADNLPSILSEIFADHLKLKVVPIDGFTANGEYQDVTISIPNENVVEANISIMSNNPVDIKLVDPTGKEQKVPSDQIYYSTSKSYSMVKLIHPAEGDWTLKVKGVKKDKININLVFNYDLKLSLTSPTDSEYKSGDQVEVKAIFSENDEELTDQELYQSMKGTLFVKDLESDKVEEIVLDTAEGFSGSFTVGDAAIYELIVKAEDNSFFRETEPFVITTTKQAQAPAPAVDAEKEEKDPFPWLQVILSVLGVLLLAVLVLILIALRKKANRGFSGQMVIEIKDEDTGERTSPQYKKLNQFRGKFTLHHLLALAPELAETNQLVFRPGKGDLLVLTNASNVTVEKSGRAMDASKGLEIKRNDRIRFNLKLVNKSIHIEYIA